MVGRAGWGAVRAGCRKRTILGVAIAAALSVLVGGCDRTESQETAGTEVVPLDVPADVDAEVVRRILQRGDCSGPFARVEVWRDTDGHVGLLVLHEDPLACSHIGLGYYTPAGTRLDRVPVIISPPPEESEQQVREELNSRHERLTEGLEAAEMIVP